MTNEDMIATLKIAAVSVQTNIPLSMLLSMAAQQIRELADELANIKG